MVKGLVIAGPTAVGKTALSIKLAKAMDAEIISADSAQVYKDLDIGTAKVTEEEMGGVIHHMLDVVEPVEKYSVGEYQRTVDELLGKLEGEGKSVVLTGGTGLYIGSVTNGLADLPESDHELRAKLMERSNESLYEELKELDPEAAEGIHPNNKRRVERALEVCLLTGKKFSVVSKENIKGNNYPFLKVALERDRGVLYERINLRVDIMMEAGLLEEVERTYKKYGENLKKVNIIGYAELIRYIDGEITLEQAVEDIKQNSRRYAKRQFTWFKNQGDYLWYNLDKMTEEEIMNDVIERVKSS
ncbi:tRNA dimethylallyltransferase [Propionigenium maris DSM 9537]|uniref:tRNA dimethylallyltransferase n=1 Tax=Propionigenium maris DSM 9537 TaxID=1123000 RepID=A0A9W6GM60_9FUSO|nr:tRNA (adenosine(37)-N6)-dimethylallyltransferase MiaA [Propionigenium maris]GLI56112.1 tRNA dimethylallyltransferase [Propionigenium maris DSM 9537]